MASSENKHTGNIIQTEQVGFQYLGIQCTHIYVYVFNNKQWENKGERGGVNLSVWKEEMANGVILL